MKIEELLKSTMPEKEKKIIGNIVFSQTHSIFGERGKLSEQYIENQRKALEKEKHSKEPTKSARKKKTDIDPEIIEREPTDKTSLYSEYRKIISDCYSIGYNMIYEGTKNGADYLYNPTETTLPDDERQYIDQVDRALIEDLQTLSREYAKELENSPERILDDLCVYIQQLTFTDVCYSLRPTEPRKRGEEREAIENMYYNTILDMLNEGLDAFLTCGGYSKENEDTLNKTIFETIIRICKYSELTADNLKIDNKNVFKDFSDYVPTPTDNQELKVIEIEGQQVLADVFPTVSKAIELTPRTPLSDVFRRGGIPKSAFDRTYSPARYKGDGFTAVIEKIDELKNSLSDRADKLLSSIEAAYISTHPSDNIVYIDFYDFCDKCKYNTSKSSIRMTKSLIKSDLNDISLLKFSANGKNGDFIDVPFIGTKGVITPKIGNPYIMCAVDPVYVQMMNKGQLTPYPRTVYQYSGTPYNIVKKLYEHYNMDSNVQKGTNNILSVKSIFTASGLKETPRTVKLWRSEIKERLEDALEKLHQGGDLIKWEYCKAKKEKLTSKEKDNIVNNTYANYIGLYIRFELKNVSDESERRARNEERREKLEEKKARAALKDAATVINNENKRKKKQKPKK